MILLQSVDLCFHSGKFRFWCYLHKTSLLGYMAITEQMHQEQKTKDTFCLPQPEAMKRTAENLQKTEGVQSFLEEIKKDPDEEFEQSGTTICDRKCGRHSSGSTQGG